MERSVDGGANFRISKFLRGAELEGKVRIGVVVKAARGAERSRVVVAGQREWKGMWQWLRLARPCSYCHLPSTVISIPHLSFVPISHDNIILIRIPTERSVHLPFITPPRRVG